MSMMEVLILAAGDQTRWQIDNVIPTPKQLVDIAGQPLLERTINMLDREGFSDPILVTHRPDFVALPWVRRTFDPAGRRWTLETLYSTRHLWGQRTVVLLGDVVYSPEALAKILAYREPIAFFGRRELRGRIVGRHYEIFALSFDLGNRGIIVSTLEKLIALLDAGILPANARRGKLRMFYENWIGVPMGSFEHDQYLFYPIEDWTDDIDEMIDYLTFKQYAVGGGWCHACFNGR